MRLGTLFESAVNSVSVGQSSKAVSCNVHACKPCTARTSVPASSVYSTVESTGAAYRGPRAPPLARAPWPCRARSAPLRPSPARRRSSRAAPPPPRAPRRRPAGAAGRRGPHVGRGIAEVGGAVCDNAICERARRRAACAWAAGAACAPVAVCTRVSVCHGRVRANTNLCKDFDHEYSYMDTQNLNTR